MRQIVCLALILIMLATSTRTRAAEEPADVTLEYVAKKAAARAMKPFHSPRLDLPEALRAVNLDYDKYREIRFRHDKALWAVDKLPFEVEFFHPGYLYQEPVRINEFSFDYVQPVRFVQDFFDYGKLRLKNQIPANTGYAGFKVLYPLNQSDKLDELGAFLGASYFRLLGKGQHYGASARGLALDCGEPDRPEEFPIFTDWWLGKPQADDRQLHLFAILDSVSCVGAYEFHIQPGETTTAEVDATLFFRPEDKILEADPNRKPLATMGVAPLTSMFWYGKSSERRFDDYRPEVHDSDGLLMRMETGETLWRPLNNASVMRHQRFATKDIRGFGLMQRDRDFSDYQDIFNSYHLVPSIWVEPKRHWGEGTVHLVELSTHYEGLDNIVAFWEPKTKPEPMEPYRIGYTMLWTRETDRKLSPNRVLATRIGLDSVNPRWRQIVIDFSGPKFAALPDEGQPQAVASCSANADIRDNQVFRMPTAGLWRAIIKMEPKAANADPVDIRCTMKNGNAVLSETWTYLWSPP